MRFLIPTIVPIAHNCNDNAKSNAKGNSNWNICNWKSDLKTHHSVEAIKITSNYRICKRNYTRSKRMARSREKMKLIACIRSSNISFQENTPEIKIAKMITISNWNDFNWISLVSSELLSWSFLWERSFFASLLELMVSYDVDGNQCILLHFNSSSQLMSDYTFSFQPPFPWMIHKFTILSNEAVFIKFNAQKK